MYSFVINHMGKDGYRYDNLIFLLNFVKDIPDMEIIVVEQGEKSVLSGLNLPLNCKHVFAENKGLFNRSWGFNVGYKNSVGDYLIFSDNDVIIPIPVLTQAMKDVVRFAVVNPYSHIVDTELNEANEIRRQRKLIDIQRPGRTGINFCGGVVLFQRGPFERIGGWDEEFRGWGGEDDALSFHKIPKILGPSAMKANQGPAIHLWHERTPNDTNRQSHYGRNIQRLNWYNATSIVEVEKTIDLDKIGDHLKYSE